MIETGGNYRKEEFPLYFLASNLSVLQEAASCSSYILLAVNELHDLGPVADLIARGKHVFLDSGVYFLSTRHAEAHDLSMNEALSLAPAEVDGFDALFKRYVEIVERFGDELWGYIEIDQGGRENKIRTRAKLEEMGLRPVPVYHPLNDGWDYFDYLAERYDRICLGNVVMASPEARKRLVATMWERRRQYPHLWIHVLGLTPGDVLAAYPLNSCDSSTWIGAHRWGFHHTSVSTAPAGRIDGRFIYHLDAPQESEQGIIKGRRMLSYDAEITRLTMQKMVRSAELELGADVGMFVQ